jgi:hypothetical protein
MVNYSGLALFIHPDDLRVILTYGTNQTITCPTNGCARQLEQAVIQYLQSESQVTYTGERRNRFSQRLSSFRKHVWLCFLSAKFPLYGGGLTAQERARGRLEFNQRLDATTCPIRFEPQRGQHWTKYCDGESEKGSPPRTKRHTDNKRIQSDTSSPNKRKKTRTIGTQTQRSNSVGTQTHVALRTVGTQTPNLVEVPVCIPFPN